MTATKRPDDPSKLREAVSAGYAKIARADDGCCGCSCGSGVQPQDIPLPHSEGTHTLFWRLS